MTQKQGLVGDEHWIALIKPDLPRSSPGNHVAYSFNLLSSKVTFDEISDSKSVTGT